MNRIELAAKSSTLAPLQGQSATTPVACTPTLGIFFSAAALSYVYNRNQNSRGYIEDGETGLVGEGLSLDQLSGDELIAARRLHSAH